MDKVRIRDNATTDDKGDRFFDEEERRAGTEQLKPEVFSLKSVPPGKNAESR